jgi:energy-converting hydrogenase Eha subunit A
VPLLTPATSPEVETTVAMAGAVLLHVPPPTPSARVSVEPTQILPVPVIAVGTGFTVSTCLILQPALIVYVTVSVPGTSPVNVAGGV